MLLREAVSESYKDAHMKQSTGLEPLLGQGFPDACRRTGSEEVGQAAMTREGLLREAIAKLPGERSASSAII